MIAYYGANINHVDSESVTAKNFLMIYQRTSMIRYFF